MVPVVLVPGSELTENGEPGPAFRARLDRAGDVVTNFGVTLVIISGRGNHPITEAESGATYLRTRLSSTRVRLVEENLSMETFGNYIFSTAAFLEPLCIRRVVTITDPGQCGRCYTIASRLWEHLSIEHTVIHSPHSEGAEKRELDDLGYFDFVHDFATATGTNTLHGALNWIRAKHTDEKARDYPRLSKAISDLYSRLSGENAELFWCLRDRASPVRDWVQEFASPDESARRRRMYASFVRGEKLTQDDCRNVFKQIAALGNATHDGLPESVGKWLLHVIPIRFAFMFDPECFNIDDQADGLQRGFGIMLRTAIAYVDSSKQTVMIRGGKRGSGSVDSKSNDSKVVTDSDLDKLRTRAAQLDLKR